jgi:hypothetical protein
MGIVRSVMFMAMVMVLPPWFGCQTDLTAAAQHEGHASTSSSALVDKVREATEAFRDVRNVPEGYGAVLGCVSGPLEGAMGVHFVNGSLLGNAELNPAQPEALIYEFSGSQARLVGVEFIVLYDVWHQTHDLNDPPTIEGQLLNFNESPNRFGLPAFYELHVWAWRDNPLGAFVDWNPMVSCEKQ